MRFEEKIAEGSVAKFSVLFGRRHYAWAALEGWTFGVRDIFLYDARRNEPGTLQYFDGESFNFAELERCLRPPWDRTSGWNLNKWPAEEVARLDAERRTKMEELEQRLFDPQALVELQLPYRLGPLCFLRTPQLEDPYSTRWALNEPPDGLRPQLMSLADRGGTQVVFVPGFGARFVTATVGPSGVKIFHPEQECAKPTEGANQANGGIDWVNGRINLIGSGSSWTNRFCVCDLEKEQVFWLRYRNTQ